MELQGKTIGVKDDGECLSYSRISEVVDVTEITRKRGRGQGYRQNQIWAQRRTLVVILGNAESHWSNLREEEYDLI